jgi:hypothetical protein
MLARQFCQLAELHVQKRHVERAQRLVDSAEKAIAVAGKYCKDPKQRQLELSALSQRVAAVHLELKQLSP